MMRFAHRGNQGQEDLERLLGAAHLTREDLCRLLGMSHRALAIYTDPRPHSMLIAFLQLHLRARNMSDWLRSRGWNPDAFKAKGLRPMPTGRYPRTARDIEELMKAVRR